MPGIGGNTVSRYLMPPDKKPAKRNPLSKPDPFKEPIDRLPDQDATVSAIVTLRRIKEMGYEGGITILRD